MYGNPDSRDEKELLREIAQLQRRVLRIGRISAVATLVLAAALVIALTVLLPRLTGTLEKLDATLEGTQQVVQRINASLDTLEQLSQSLPDLGGEGGEKLGGLLDALGTIDLDAFTESIQKFNSISEYLSNFRLFG